MRMRRDSVREVTGLLFLLLVVFWFNYCLLSFGKTL